MAKHWVGSAGGYWDVGANWSDGLVPTASDDILIDVPLGQFTITVRDTRAVKSVLISGDETLAIGGGSLSVTGGSYIEGALSLSSGSLIVEGALTTKDFLFSGGTLTGAGTVTTDGAFTWSGGYMTGGGKTLVSPGAVLTISGHGGPENAIQLNRMSNGFVNLKCQLGIIQYQCCDLGRAGLGGKQL